MYVVMFSIIVSYSLMTDGNLITHLRTLLNAKLVDETREITTRTHTYYSLTRAGRSAFEKYLAILEAIVRSAKT